MSAISLQGNAGGTGTLTVAAPSTNTNRTLTLPDGTGTFTVAGVNSNIVAGTSVASTSGTSIDFTGIPTWVKRITVMLNGISTSGTSNPLIQLGAGSVTSTGYLGSSSGLQNASSVSAASFTTGFGIFLGSSSNIIIGHLIITNVSGNIWLCSSVGGLSGSSITFVGGGNVTLGGTLDRVRITTVGGTDTFDAGSINILYE